MYSQTKLSNDHKYQIVKRLKYLCTIYCVFGWARNLGTYLESEKARFQMLGLFLLTAEVLQKAFVVPSIWTYGKLKPKQLICWLMENELSGASRVCPQ